jgi:hypothetical protein
MVDLFTFKVLIVGAFGVGKTTFIQQISSVPVVGTEVSTTGDEAQVKDTTTVGIEYGVFSVRDDEVDVILLLFGTPGQDRFSDIREIAARGIDGLIVLVDGRDRSSWHVGAELYTTFNPDRVIPAIVVVNRWSDGGDSPDGLIDAMGVRGDVGIVHGHVIDVADARRFLIELLSVVLEREVGDDDRAMEVV